MLKHYCLAYGLCLMALAGCGGDSSSSNNIDNTPNLLSGAGNHAPTIGGSPATSVLVNAAYSFTPIASDDDLNDTLSFSIVNQPSWASFDSVTGVLSGSPTSSDIGDHSGIVIIVSDTKVNSSLATFSIDVQASGGAIAQNYPGIPLPHVLLTHDPDSKGADWQANPEPWATDPRTDVTPSWPAGWPGTAVANHWYIDSTHVNATNSNMGDNAIGGTVYGTPDRPRATLMGNSIFPAGTYVEIQGGPYNSGAGRWQFQCTTGEPCWITSDQNNKAVLAGSAGLILEGSSYLTVENLLWDPESPGAITNTSNTAISMSYNGDRGATHHVTIRHVDFRRWSFIGGGGGIISVGSDNRSGGHETHHILVYNATAIEAGNNASRGCDWTADDCDNHFVGITTRIQDGVTTNSTHHIWILDSHSEQISGNQVQAISLGTPTVDWRETVHHIYVGGGTHTNSRQSGWWAKRSSNFIVSSSRAWNLRAYEGSNGQASGMQYGPNWVWFINNDFSDADFGIQQTDTGDEADPADSGKLFVLGNRFYNIGRHSLPTKTDAWRGGFAISAWHNAAAHYIAFNTCVSCESGLAIKIRAIDNIHEGAFVWNNIMHSMEDAVGSFVEYSPNGFAWAHDNVFWDDANFKVYWSGVYTSLTDWSSANSAYVYDNINSDPLLTNTLTTHPARDYSIGVSSPAADAGASVAADGTDPFALYLQRYGMDISEDVAGNTRIVPFSAGAHE